MALTAPPTAPDILDRVTFQSRSQAWVLWVRDNLIPELNTIIGATIPAGSAAAGTLTGGTLAANVLASSLTSVGTLSGLAVSGQSNLGNTAVTGNLTASQNSGIASTKKIYWDGIGINGDTHTSEVAANQLDTVVGGNLRQHLTDTTCSYYGFFAIGDAEVEGSWAPGTDNTYTLGTAGKRWTTVYATTGAINTSSALDKTEVVSLTPEELAAAKQLSKEIGTFRFLDAIQKKGAAARMHIGLTVQRAIGVMEAHGLDPFAYGFICYDEWAEKQVEHPAEVRVEETGLLDEQGAQITREVVVKEAWTKVEPAGSQYGFRTDELLLFIARGFEARLAALEA